MWDLRGGRSAAAFQSHKEVFDLQMFKIRLANAVINRPPYSNHSSLRSPVIWERTKINY